MNNIKDFPKTRVSVVDVFPYFKEGFKRAMDFSRQHNIPINSPDGIRVIYGYCLKNIKDSCKQLKNKYPTILCISNKGVTKKLEPFVNNHFPSLARFFPFPYCGKYDLTSPELEMAAESILQKSNKKQETKELAQKLRLKVS